MSRALNDLTSRFRPLAIELIARSVEAGVAIMIVDTVRTKAEQAINLSKGVSATTHSQHLPLGHRLNGESVQRLLESGSIDAGDVEKADAIDVAPYLVYQQLGPDKVNWDARDSVWFTIGQIGERLGLRWGGRWTSPNDPGHFEWVDPADVSAVARWTQEKGRQWLGRQRL